MSDYIYPLADALADLLAETGKENITTAVLNNYNALESEQKARVLVLLSKGVPIGQTSAIATGPALEYRMVLALLDQSVSLATINTNLATMRGYSQIKQAGLLATVDSGETFADACTFIDGL